MGNPSVTPLSNVQVNTPLAILPLVKPAPQDPVPSALKTSGPVPRGPPVWFQVPTNFWVSVWVAGGGVEVLPPLLDPPLLQPIIPTIKTKVSNANKILLFFILNFLLFSFLSDLPRIKATVNWLAFPNDLLATLESGFILYPLSFIQKQRLRHSDENRGDGTEGKTASCLGGIPVFARPFARSSLMNCQTANYPRFSYFILLSF